MLKTIVATIAIGLLATAIGQAADGEDTGLQVGDKAPDFSLTGSDGKTYTLSKIKQPVVLAWFPKAFTGG